LIHRSSQCLVSNRLPTRIPPKTKRWREGRAPRHAVPVSLRGVSRRVPTRQSPGATITRGKRASRRRFEAPADGEGGAEGAGPGAAILRGDESRASSPLRPGTPSPSLPHPESRKPHTAREPGRATLCGEHGAFTAGANCRKRAEMPRKGGTDARGYTRRHKNLRKSWERVVASGRGALGARSPFAI
jgi:hypothetical protein